MVLKDASAICPPVQYLSCCRKVFKNRVWTVCVFKTSWRRFLCYLSFMQICKSSSSPEERGFVRFLWLKKYWKSLKVYSCLNFDLVSFPYSIGYLWKHLFGASCLYLTITRLKQPSSLCIVNGTERLHVNQNTELLLSQGVSMSEKYSLGMGISKSFICR